MRYNDRKRKITMNDVANFTIRIEAVMDSKDDALPYLVKFLHDTKNGENANFLKDVSEFRDIKYDTNRKEKAEYIIKMYVQENSTHELNMSNDMRQSIINFDGGCKRSMFDQLENYIVASINEHIFPLFLKSKLFQSFVESSTLDTLYQIGSPNIGTMLYCIDKLSGLDEYVTQSDVQFIESQVSDSMEG